MPFDHLKTLDVIEIMEAFLDRRRPPEHIRPKLDITYEIEGQNVTIFEVRPQWNNPSVIRQHPVAKATFVKSANSWKVYWMRGNLKWQIYEPKPTVKTLHEWTKLVEEDVHGCFWG
jgi:hypothetical protein